MSNWSVQRVEQLAPDAAAIKAAQGIARPGKWLNIGRDERTVWGECQGSGSNPYQVRVDLEDAACKCSCPSRKLPCKHALGLLLMLACTADIPRVAAPAFVAEWTAGRAKRAESKASRPVAEDKPADAQAQSKRVEKRAARIETGLAQLDAWLADLMAQGLAAARAQPASFWERMASRLIDAQAPALARRVRELGELAVSGADWQSRLLAALARTQLLIDAYRRLDKLPPALAAEVRTLLGWTQEQSALLERPGVRDRWQVLGRRQSQLEQVRVQHTWLFGLQSRQSALILEFAVGNQPLPVAFVVGQVVDAELVLFDGAPPMRALLKQRYAGQPSARTLPGALDVAALQSTFAAALAMNPWVERWPAILGPVRVTLRGEETFFVDEHQRRITARPNFRYGWHLLSLAAGETLSLFGLWDGHVFDPLTVAQGDHLYCPSHIGELPVLARVA